jgi:hypothetical protein
VSRYTPDQQRAYDAGYAAGLRAAQAETHEPLTMEQIKAMSTEEVAKRLPEVNEVLGGGQR